jgi:YD repeat-containing protein
LLLATSWFAGPALAGDFQGDSTNGQVEPPEAVGDPGCKPEGTPAKGPGDPVSPFTGKWFYRHVDLEVPGIFPIELVRRYDSQTTYQSPLGAGWAFTHDWRLFRYADGSVTVRNACGQLHRYAAGTLTTDDAPGWRMSLAADPGVTNGYVLREPRGTQRFFDAQGRMTTLRDPQGNELRFTYGGAKQPLSGTSPYAAVPATPLIVSTYYPLQTIEEATAAGALTGRSVSFTYDATSGRLVEARSHDGRGVVYTHEMMTVNGQLLTTGNLTQVRLETTPGGAGGVVQTFGYANTTYRHAVTSFQDGAGRRTVKNSYDAQGRVTQQLLAGTPDVLLFEFNYAPTSFPYSNDFTGCDGSFQCRVVKEHIRGPNDAELALSTTAYKFRADGYLVEEIDAEGHRAVNVYDGLRPSYLDRTELYRFASAGGEAATRVLEKLT